VAAGPDSSATVTATVHSGMPSCNATARRASGRFAAKLAGAMATPRVWPTRVSFIDINCRAIVEPRNTERG
jgi:hypothetical protein